MRKLDDDFPAQMPNLDDPQVYELAKSAIRITSRLAELEISAKTANDEYLQAKKRYDDICADRDETKTRVSRHCSAMACLDTGMHDYRRVRGYERLIGELAETLNPRIAESELDQRIHVARVMRYKSLIFDPKDTLWVDEPKEETQQ